MHEVASTVLLTRQVVIVIFDHGTRQEEIVKLLGIVNLIPACSRGEAN